MRPTKLILILSLIPTAAACGKIPEHESETVTVSAEAGETVRMLQSSMMTQGPIREEIGPVTQGSTVSWCAPPAANRSICRIPLAFVDSAGGSGPVELHKELVWEPARLLYVAMNEHPDTLTATQTRDGSENYQIDRTLVSPTGDLEIHCRKEVRVRGFIRYLMNGDGEKDDRYYYCQVDLRAIRSVQRYSGR